MNELKAAFTFPPPHHEEDEVFRWKMHSLKTCFPSGVRKPKMTLLKSTLQRQQIFPIELSTLQKKFLYGILLQILLSNGFLFSCTTKIEFPPLDSLEQTNYIIGKILCQ